MRKIWNWTKDNAGPIAVTIAILGGFAAIIQFSVVRPMHQGFDAVNQRIDDQITYIHQHFDDQNISINQRFDDQIISINQRFDDQNRSINQRFDDQNISINRRFDDQNRSINQRFDAVHQRFNDQNKLINQRFDAQDGRIEDLVKDFSELRKLSDRVTRNETRIDTLTEQLQTADAPSPPD